MKIGFFGALTIIFITLKLTEVIDWSWWFVLLPLLGIPILIIVSFILLFILAIPFEISKERKK